MSTGFSFGAPAQGGQTNPPAAGGGGLFKTTSIGASGANTGFNFGNAAPAGGASPLFGGQQPQQQQQQAAAPSFGGFGATPQSAPSGTAPATGAFNLTLPTGPSQAAPAPTGGFFGQQPQQQPQQQQPSFFGFGQQQQQQQQPQQQQQQQQSQQQQPAFGGGIKLFGQTTQQPTQPAGGLFGGAQTGAFGPTSASGAPQAAPADLTPFPEDRLLKDVLGIRESLDPAGPSYKLRSLVLNVVPAEQRIRPGHVSDAEWREAMDRAGGESNADHLWPVLASGFTDLNARRAVQEAVLGDDTARRERVAEIIRTYRRNIEVNIQGRIDNARRRQGELMRAMVQLLKLLDALEGRLAAQMGMTGDRQALAALQERMRQLEFLLDSPQGLQRKVDGLHAAMGRMHGRQAGGTGTGLTQRMSASGADAAVSDPASLHQLHEALRAQVEAAAKLQEVLLRAQRNVGILESEGKGYARHAHRG